MEDYYKILKVKPDCTLEELDRKYERLLKEFDPETQSDEGLKDFFKSEQDKIKEAYKEIFSNISAKKKDKEFIEDKPKNKVLSSAKKKNVAKKSVKKKSKKIVNKAAQKFPIKKNINKDKKNNKKKFSISSEINLKLKRAYLIMFILGFPLLYIYIKIIDNIDESILEIYYDAPFTTLLFHFLGAVLVFLYHLFLIIRSSGFLSIRANLLVYFTERKIYFIRILAFTPFVLLSLCGWGGMIHNSEIMDYWYNRYQEVQDVISGDNYDSGCKNGKNLKVHNLSNQDLQFRISYKKNNGEWSRYGNWSIKRGQYTGTYLEENGDMDFVTDYRYYIQTTNYEDYLYSADIPHITNICNAKCINIY